jgi:hypothetical protein
MTPSRRSRTHEKEKRLVIPVSITEQAGLVVLFAILVVTILEFAGKQEGKRQSDLIAFILRRDEDWKGFLKEVRTEDQKRQDKTDGVLEKMSVVLVDMDKFIRISLSRMVKKGKSVDRGARDGNGAI